MAQFRGTVQGQRGEASRLGSKNSGLVVEGNGWNVGARIVLEHEDGKDKIWIYKTGGSKDRSPYELLYEGEVAE